jgi:hypothetical protein
MTYPGRATDLPPWQTTQGAQETLVEAALGAEAEASRRRLEIAMDGVKAHIDGRWQKPTVATILGVGLLPSERASL